MLMATRYSRHYRIPYVIDRRFPKIPRRCFHSTSGFSNERETDSIVCTRAVLVYVRCTVRKVCIRLFRQLRRFSFCDRGVAKHTGTETVLLRMPTS
jgi:hypothetical protein